MRLSLYQIFLLLTSYKRGVSLREPAFFVLILTEIGLRRSNLPAQAGLLSKALKSEYLELFKDGLSEGEGVGVGINFQQKIICGLCLVSAEVRKQKSLLPQDLERFVLKM